MVVEWAELEMSKLSELRKEAEDLINKYRFGDRNDDLLRQAVGKLGEQSSLIYAARERALTRNA